jgi:SAM-dependent methyltransferase
MTDVLRPDPGPPIAPPGLAAPTPDANGYLRRVFRATEEANRRAVLDALPAGRGGHLLDIGTHDGTFTRRIVQRVRPDRVTGVEVMSMHAQHARSRGLDVVEADIEDGLPFPAARFDVITANQVIEHVRRTDVVLAEVRRVLAPGGVACISTNNLCSWHNVVSLALGLQPPPVHVSDEVIVGNPLNPEDGWPHDDWGRSHVRLFSGRALCELAAHHGLALRRLAPVGYYPLPPRVARAATRLDASHCAFLVATFGEADPPPESA